MRSFIVIATCVALAGCEATLKKVNEDLRAVNQSLQSSNQGFSVGRGLSYDQNNSANIVFPEVKDEKTMIAFRDAWPTVKEVISIHRCVNNIDGMLAINKYAIPGKNLADWPYTQYPMFRSPSMQYHDRSRCLAVRGIYDIQLKALNAMALKAAFYSETSGEVANGTYLLMRDSSTGKWRVAGIGA